MYIKCYPAYQAKGLAVTPLFGKRPLIDNWQETTADKPYSYPTYETKNNKIIHLKSANIGLLCGEPSGVICIDIDTDDKNIIKMILDSLPETPVMKKGKKGVNFFYQYNGEQTNNYKNPITKKDNLFELISTGRQTVLPPSVHPDSKKPYIWCDRYGDPTHTTSLLDVEKVDLPFLPANWFNDLDQKIINYFQNKPTQQDNGGGVASLLSPADLPVRDHKDMAGYAPKSPEEIPKGYENRCRSGAHSAVIERLMSFINKGYSQQKAVKEILKYDKEYNEGYAKTYYECDTCKYRQGDPTERAIVHYLDMYKTVSVKKIADGEVIPQQKGGGSNLPKEMQIVEQLIEKFVINYERESSLVFVENSDLIQQDGDFYRYTYDGRWQLLSEHDINSFKRIISKLYGCEATNTKIDSTYKLFTRYIPGPPDGIDMKIPRGDRLVLSNCTLHVNMTGSGYKMERHEHSRADYCTNRINLPYQEKEDRNEAFDKMLDDIFEGDEDADEKRLAICELYGAAVMPVFPKIFFLHGKAGCGKSTLFITLNNLLSPDNVGAVDPGDFKGFLIEPLIGKMVNIVTDIRSNTAIEASVLKQIEDRMPFTIQRKGKQNIRAPLPAVHGFGANDLPKNFDSNAKAFGRRVIFIGFSNVMSSRDNSGQYTHDRNFGNKVFNVNPQGVLNFAIEGIKRLCAQNGQYTQPRSGFKTLDEWQSEYNVADQFFFDLEGGEVEGIGSYVPVLSEEGKIKRTELWEIFKKWMTDTNRGRQKITKQAFYKLIAAKFEVTKSSGVLYFKGVGEQRLGVCEGEESTVDSPISREY